MRRRLLIALPLLVLLAAAGPAEGYNVGGARWPGKPARITYYEETGPLYRWPIAEAAAAWNTSGVRVHFVRVRQRSKARLVITESMSVPPGGGYASIGYMPHASIQLNMGSADKWAFTAVVAHEMGHVLGLEHVTNICAVMTAEAYVSCKPEWPPHPWQWRCRVLQKDDLAGAQSRYGGKARLRHRMFCDKAHGS